LSNCHQFNKRQVRVEHRSRTRMSSTTRRLKSGMKKAVSALLVGATLATSDVACRRQDTEEDLPKQVSLEGDLRTETKIAFVSDRDGNYEVYIVNPDGSDQKRLTRHPADDESPRWSPDGKRIAFVSSRDGNREIYVMNADGSEQRDLTNNAAEDLDPSWSPDGKMIAFCSYRGRAAYPEICVMNADGRRQKQLTDNLAVVDWHPCWSPNGNSIAFVSDRIGDYDIYVMNTDGSRQRNLSCHPGDEYEPSWSPDGTKIAFIGYAVPNAICVMYADGSEQKKLTNVTSRWPTTDGRSPSWSPDGKMIAFCAAWAGAGEICIMHADGSELRNLTNNPAMDYSPSWSPFLPSETE